MTPFETTHDEINCVETSNVHRLVALGGIGGSVTCWDPRTRKQVGACDVSASGAEITSLGFDDASGLKLVAGSSDGFCSVFDLRSSKPLAVKEHRTASPSFPHGSLANASSAQIRRL